MPNYIKRIGIEFEGGWYSRPPDLRRDGSVDLSNISDPRLQHVGEISSPPYAKLATVEEWMLAYHPNVSNYTCGFHIHVSVENDGFYSRLMCNEFFQAYLDAYTKWGEEFLKPHVEDGALLSDEQEYRLFSERLAGHNRYCRREFNPDHQAAYEGRQDGERMQYRYCMLNFCHRLHGTLESRLLPMFRTPSISVSAVNVFVNVINKWLEEDLAKPSVLMESDIVEQTDLSQPTEIIQLSDGQIKEGLFDEPNRGGYAEFLREIAPSAFAGMNLD